MDSESFRLVMERKRNECCSCIPARYIMTFLVFCGLFVIYVLRVNLSVAMVAMVNNSAIESRDPEDTCFHHLNLNGSEEKKYDFEKDGEFTWDPVHQSLILGAFYYGYTLTQLPGGWLSEKYGGKWPFGIGVLITSALTIITPLAARVHVGFLVLTRIIKGLGEGVTFPAMYSMFSRWAPLKERSLLIAVASVGANLGTVAGMPSTAYLCEYGFLGGWPSAFYICGTLGCIWCVFWSAIAHSRPTRHPRITNTELIYLKQTLGPRKQRPPTPWKSILTSVPVLAVTLARFAGYWGLFTLISELPNYLKNMLHLTIDQNGFANAIIYTFQSIGMVCGGYFSDLVRTRTSVHINTNRKVFETVGCFGPAICLLFVPLAGCNRILVVTLITLGQLLYGFNAGGSVPAMVDLAPDFAGTVSGVVLTAASCAGFMAPLVAGKVVQSQDVWTDEAGYVNVDDHNDCELLNLKRRGHVTRLSWSRKFDTCDPQDYYIEDGTTHIVYAIGKGPIRRLEGIRIVNEKHGFQRVQLLKNLAAAPVFPDDTQTITIHNDKVHVPGVETTYWCSLHLLPKEFEKKKHIIQYAASIQEGNEAVVHHMEIFHCEVSSEEKLPPWNGPCHSDEKPTILEACKRVLAAWAMGALPFYYPEEAGLPIGGADFSRYVMLEVHYNNPELKSDWIDSSGITLWYTPTLREFDAGVMELGLEYTDKMAIPPHQESFTLTGYCVSECTRAGLPPEGIVIFGSQLHTHLTGIIVYTKHVRGGQELPELNRDNHYSTHFQEIRFLKRKVRVWPGDALLTTCHYSTMDRQNITLGGFAISDEMCVNYVHYFPKTDLEVCKSSIDSQVLNSYFRYMNQYNDEPTTEDKGISENYKSVHWSQNNADFLHQLYYNAPLSMQCNKSSGDRFPGFWEGIPRTEIFYPLPPPKRKCFDKVKNNEDVITALESK